MKSWIHGSEEYLHAGGSLIKFEVLWDRISQVGEWIERIKSIASEPKD